MIEITDIMNVKIVIGFYIPPRTCHLETGPRFQVSSERLEKSGIELRTPGFQDECRYNYTTAASNTINRSAYELGHEKTNIVHMRKQRRRSASW